MIKIKTDSRKVVQGDTFVALPGISSDGHDYIDDAIENGAKYIICENHFTRLRKMSFKVGNKWGGI